MATETYGWEQLPPHVRRRVCEDRDVNYAMYHIEHNAATRRCNRARDVAARASVSPSGYVTFARAFLPFAIDTEPKPIVKSLVRAIWRDHAASKRDPWREELVAGVRDLGRAYDGERGYYRRRVRFDGGVYESDERNDVSLEPEHVVVRLLAMRDARELGLDKDRAYHHARRIDAGLHRRA